MDSVSASVHGGIRSSDKAAAAQFGYSPFGQLETGSFDNAGIALRFGSREFDEETQLYYFRNRYYDPQLARFISEDPLGVAAGINMYQYVGNDPINGWDPTGLRQCPGSKYGACAPPKPKARPPIPSDLDPRGWASDP